MTCSSRHVRVQSEKQHHRKSQNLESRTRTRGTQYEPLSMLNVTTTWSNKHDGDTTVTHRKTQHTSHQQNTNSNPNVIPNNENEIRQIINVLCSNAVLFCVVVPPKSPKRELDRNPTTLTLNTTQPRRTPPNHPHLHERTERTDRGSDRFQHATTPREIVRQSRCAVFCTALCVLRCAVLPHNPTDR